MAETATAPAAIDKLEAALREQFADAIGERGAMQDITEFAVAEPGRVRDLMAWLHDVQGFNHLVLLSTIDRLDRLEVVYFLDTMPDPGEKGRVAFRVALDRESPRLPSIADVYEAANWHEREAYDMMGIVFENHPDFRRILLPDIWVGHPLRKDYQYDANTMVDEILEHELAPAPTVVHDQQGGDFFVEAQRIEHNGLVTQDIAINMGPQHPSTHGVLRLRLQLDGEYIRTCDPDLGFLHRAFEKLGELKTYINGIPLTDRWDYLDAMGNNQIHCQVTEKRMEQEVPERAHWIRMLVLELNRVASHLVFIGTYGLDVGAATPFLHCFRDRERVLDMFELLCGARLTYNYIRIGGVSADIPRNFISDRVRPFLDYLPGRLDEVNNLLTGNQIFLSRTRGVGVFPADRAIQFAMTGPMLRAAGVPRDVRKLYPYARYDQVEFDVPLGDGNADCFDRYIVRVREIGESIKILHQICDWFDANDKETRGEYQGKLPRSIKPPVGESYTSIETPRGELGLHLVSDGSEQPYRYKIRRPSFINLGMMREVGRDQKVADLIAILGTTDIVMGEVDG